MGDNDDIAEEPEEPKDWGDADEDRAQTRGASRMGPAMRLLSAVLLVLVGGCIGGAIVRWVHTALQDDDPPPEVIEVRATPDVISAVRNLARLETTSFHIERVIDMTSRQRRLFGAVQAEDSILLVAASDVVAGVDLAELREEDVEVSPDGNRVTITLPPPEIFSARLDNDLTYVHHRETDVLAERRETLETEARREAERTLQQAALEGGILTHAERNARTTVEGLLRGLGFDEVVITYRADLD